MTASLFTYLQQEYRASLIEVAVDITDVGDGHFDSNVAIDVALSAKQIVDHSHSLGDWTYVLTDNEGTLID